MSFTLHAGLHVETIDTGLLVLVPGRDDVVHLTGHDAEAFELARVCTDTVPDHLAPAMAGLVTLGIVDTDAWSRRRVLQLGGAAAAAAAVTIALPGVAAAASTPGGTTPGGGDTGGPGGTTTDPTTPKPLLYVSENYYTARSVIRVDTDGSQTEIPIGDPTTGYAMGPRAIAMGPGGIVYVINNRQGQIVTLDAENNQSVFASGLSMEGIAVDSTGTVYVTDTDDSQVIRIEPDGTRLVLLQVVYDPDDEMWPMTNAITIGPDGLLYVTDARRTGVYRVPPDGDTTLYLHYNELDFVPVTGLHQPEGIAFDSKGNLYVSDIALDKIVRLDTDGNQSNFATAVDWDGPWGITFDAEDNLYVADSSNNRVVEVDAAGDFVAEVGTGHAWPSGIALA